MPCKLVFSGEPALQILGALRQYRKEGNCSKPLQGTVLELENDLVTDLYETKEMFLEPEDQTEDFIIVCAALKSVLETESAHWHFEPDFTVLNQIRANFLPYLNKGSQSSAE